MIPLTCTHSRFLQALQPAPRRGGLLSVSPTRQPVSLRTLTPCARTRDTSPLPDKWKELRRKRGFALLDWLSGREAANSAALKPDSSPTVTDSSSMQPSKRLRKGKKAVFFAKDKEHVERYLLEVLRKKEPEPLVAKPLSDIEKLAREAEEQRSPLRGRLMTEQVETGGMDFAEDVGQASPQFHPSPNPIPPPSLELSPADPMQLLSTKASPTKSDQTLFFPAVSPQVQTKAYRRLIEIPAFPFGKHKPIPEKVEMVLLDMVEVRIRRKRAKLRRMLGEINAELV